MTTVLYILLAVLMFGVLILIHELGHFLCARAFGVRVLEFSIGFGPVILKRISKKSGTQYSLRLFFLGGYVNMGEDDKTSDDEELPKDSFRAQPVWKRIVITSAGAIMNIVLGFVLTLILVLNTPVLGSTTISGFAENAVSPEYGLSVGDEVVRVGGTGVHTSNELVYEVFYKGYRPIDITVRRDGEEIVLKGVSFSAGEEDGVSFGQPDFYVAPAEKNFGSVIKFTFYRSLSSIKMVWDSLIGLLTGRFGVQSVSGPIGITSAITEAAQQGFDTVIYMFSVITMNLGIFNLLPLPALDGGRLLFMLIELVRGKPVKPEYESYVHFAGLVILLLISVIIAVKDIFQIFWR